MKPPHYSSFNLILLLLGGIVLLFILAPLVNITLKTEFSELSETVFDKEVTQSIWLTLWTSMLATLIMAIGAIPLAWILARKNFVFKRLLTGIIDLPVVIPHSAAGIAILGVLSRDSWPGQIAENLGISLVGHPAGIMVAMAFVSIPFLINSAREGFALIPERIEIAAANLGASPARIFFTVSLPLAWRSIVSGLTLMFARGMSEFGAVVIIAYHPMITPVLIFERFGAFGLQYARPVSVIFIGICLAIFVLLRLLVKENKSRA
jgi:molybdate/tungstate transport system permease protein